jgi:S1-C subfamily serine protease
MKLRLLSLALASLCVLSVPVASQAFDPPYRQSWHAGYWHIHQRYGLRINSVAWRSPAFYAGLERGDIILEVDGRKVRYPEQLHQALHRTGVRGVLTVRDARTGRIRDVRVYPSNGHIGVTLSPISY